MNNLNENKHSTNQVNSLSFGGGRGEAIKETVREKYAAIAEQPKEQNQASCCGATSACCGEVSNLMADDYAAIEGYNPEADLGLGCGLPTEFAKISQGDTVIDLGSGAGNDCFIARRLTGENGRIIGIDFTEQMISRARENAEKLQLKNVEFRLGDIESLPVSGGIADVVVSNCVLNLVPDKPKVFSEIFRVLKDRGHFSISDIVLEGALPGRWKEIAELYAGCVSGAIQKTEYLELIEKAGFKNIIVQKDKPINIPDDILLNYLSVEEMEAYKNSGTKISSITVYAEKPGKENKNCCLPGSSCC
ncbi:MAG TPA: arsenite methyltransferase [Ferruginibacter sp.]|nr:arsenite methyltransferase [Ferruginibacter sp.]